ncbi:MAG: 3D domain-containing protein [Bacteriovoracaceae bacterium]
MRMTVVASIMVLTISAAPVLAKHGSEKSFSPPTEVSDLDLQKIPDLLPTMYYTPLESEVNCKGGYGRVRYRGNEKETLLTPEGKVLATVCKRFSATLLMEGAGILRDRGNGEIAVNFGGRIKGKARYYPLGRCKYGAGIRRDLCLLPYHTIAGDNRIHQIDDIIYVPEAKGLELPDGSIHDGYFVVRDTGGAFTGIGSQRVDMFTGTDPDFNNVFQKAGFHHKRPMEAYKINGASADEVRQKLRDKFGDLY